MNRGFSLVELLIVVVILGILSAIAMPEFQSQSQEAKGAAAKDNLRILRHPAQRRPTGISTRQSIIRSFTRSI